MSSDNSIISVLIADDHAMTRKGLSVFLLANDRFKLIGEASNGQQAIELCHQFKPDIVLMDVIMPQTDGITAIKRIKIDLPDTQIIAMSSFGKEELIQQAILYGADAFIPKDVSAKDLIDLILHVVQGTYMQKAFSDSTELQLTERELEVLRLMAHGRANKNIADELNISLATVKTHLQNIYAKLEVRNRVEATLVSIKHGLII